MARKKGKGWLWVAIGAGLGLLGGAWYLSQRDEDDDEDEEVPLSQMSDEEKYERALSIIDEVVEESLEVAAEIAKVGSNCAALVEIIDDVEEEMAAYKRLAKELGRIVTDLQRSSPDLVKELAPHGDRLVASWDSQTAAIRLVDPACHTDPEVVDALMRLERALDAFRRSVQASISVYQ